MRKTRLPHRDDKRNPARRLRPYSKRIRTRMLEIWEGLAEYMS